MLTEREYYRRLTLDRADRRQFRLTEEERLTVIWNIMQRKELGPRAPESAHEFREIAEDVLRLFHILLEDEHGDDPS